jgi:hypothetical protein
MDAIRNHSATPWTSGLTPTFFKTFTESPEPIRNRVSVRLFTAGDAITPLGVLRLVPSSTASSRR